MLNEIFPDCSGGLEVMIKIIDNELIMILKLY